MWLVVGAAALLGALGAWMFMFRRVAKPAARGPALRAAEAALPVDMVEVRPGRTLAVHARLRADADKIVFFVHGSCASMLQWRAQIEALADGGHSVVAFDCFGCGRSPKPSVWAAYSFANLQASSYNAEQKKSCFW